MDQIEHLLEYGVEDLIGGKEIIDKINQQKKLVVKLGVDPTAPDLHLGHAVVLRKLKEFQDLGHQIVFLIGDYTVKIGDPSGRNKTRPVPTDEEIEENTKTYIEQVGKVLDTSNAKVEKNSRWFEKMSLSDFIKLASKMTVASILERDDFDKRRKAGVDIGLHELIYPLMQGYDSVELKADIELGGTDQIFNLLAGRELMRKMGLDPQAVMTLPILIGLDGKKKMSKSLGNYVALNDPPKEMYGKIMSISDELIVSYFKLCTDLTPEAIEVVEDELERGKNPRDIKARLAKLIVEIYYDSSAAKEAENEFIRVFRQGEKPSEMQQLNIKRSQYAIADLVQRAGTSSVSEARRLIGQGGVKIDDEVVTDPNTRIEPEDGMIIQIGKRRFYKVKLN